jgi:RNA 2',3'-cyclic 3'-phosphodiesterase
MDRKKKKLIYMKSIPCVNGRDAGEVRPLFGFYPKKGARPVERSAVPTESASPSRPRKRGSAPGVVLLHHSTTPLRHPALFFPMLPSKRLFVGLELPESCKTTLLSLDPHVTGLRWLVEEQFHLTLSFLGNIETPEEDLLRHALCKVRVPPFFLPVYGVGVFNVRGQPSIVWAGVGKGHPHLFTLHRRIQDAVLRAGLEPDLKPFHPHITMGRAKGISRQALQPFMRQYAEADLGLFGVTGFGLFSSVLSPQGAIHRLEMWQDF